MTLAATGGIAKNKKEIKSCAKIGKGEENEV